MLLREIFIGGARAPPAPPHATALPHLLNEQNCWFQTWLHWHSVQKGPLLIITQASMILDNYPWFKFLSFTGWG